TGKLARCPTGGSTMSDETPRDRLPLPDPTHEPITVFDAKDPAAVFPPIQPLRPPAGSPNVLIVLLDDVGFGASSAVGGPSARPTAAGVGSNGLRCHRRHTTPLCGPTL